MRCRSREGPCGSHQLEARALKWDTSVGSTEDVEVEVLEAWASCWRGRLVVMVRAWRGDADAGDGVDVEVRREAGCDWTRSRRSEEGRVRRRDGGRLEGRRSGMIVAVLGL